MQQVKLFKSIESELQPMEDEINQWIEESGAKVISITGNIAPQSGGSNAPGPMSAFSGSDVVVIVLYEKN